MPTAKNIMLLYHSVLQCDISIFVTVDIIEPILLICIYCTLKQIKSFSYYMSFFKFNV